MSRITEAQTLAQLRAGIQIVNPDSDSASGTPVNVSLSEIHGGFHHLQWLQAIEGSLNALQSGGGAPADDFATGRKDVTTSAAILAADEEASRGVMLSALVTNSGTVFIGETNGVSASNGFPLEPGANMTLGVDNVNLIYAVTASGTETVAFLAV